MASSSLDGISNDNNKKKVAGYMCMISMLFLAFCRVVNENVKDLVVLVHKQGAMNGKYP